MAWLEVSVKVVSEAAEAVSEVLSRYAPDGVAILVDCDSDVAVIVKAYLPIDDEIDLKCRKLEEGLWYLHKIWPVIPEPQFNPIEDQDWTAGWKDSIPVLHIGGHVVIKPSWRNYAPAEDEVLLELDPGLAFGSGLHPTTQLCIEILDDVVESRMRVLDIGTGTGILAISAAKLGAHYVLAVDTDADSIVAAGRNIRQNSVQDIVDLEHGSLAHTDGMYDIVVVNILSHIIISMIEEGMAQRLNPNGILVVSGILIEQIDEVRSVIERNGLTVTEIRQRDDWAALIAKHAQ
jgi:ribosomal protein L11 methyltransferase